MTSAEKPLGPLHQVVRERRELVAKILRSGSALPFRIGVEAAESMSMNSDSPRGLRHSEG